MALVVHQRGPTAAGRPEYHALGAGTPLRSANVVVLFESESREKDMRAALDAADARLVDGPTETGAYFLFVDGNKRELALEDTSRQQCNRPCRADRRARLP